MDTNLITSHCFSLFLQIQKCTNSNLGAQSAAATAEEEEGRHRQRQLCADRALLLLNRLAHAQGLPNVFAKDSTVRPATDFFKINERHHTHLDKLVEKLEDEAATNGPMASKTASAFSSPFASSSALRGNGVPNSKFKKRAQRRNARATERAQQLQTVVPDPLPIWMSLLRTKLFQVNSSVGLFWLAEKLCSVDEFAFDFELTCFVHVGHPREQCICLLQISTEDTDILVDVLVDEVRDNFRPILATVFADKRIKKVCHGAQERTFLGQLGISHAEPLVDTSGGCRRNLRSLVYEACGVWLDKSLATADWTRRPLTKQMVDYARCDTHYLLRCYHHLVQTGRL
ncbi:hypothetical protein niasHT_025654 [Heterodera trifolii]|uniref:3'-5' exonuclease domain-containing protein n=1 Tax=Heterodera trifolii TaxID=157864 RepID=A0ABD2KHS1_9BILA